MSEKPNPSLDCASLVRFSALPLYHSTELQSCWAVIRSPSLLQTPPLRPMFSHLSSPIATTTHPLDNKKKMFIFLTSLHIPGLYVNLSQDSPWKKSEKKKGAELMSSKAHQRNLVGVTREQNIRGNGRQAGRNFCRGD